MKAFCNTKWLDEVVVFFNYFYTAEAFLGPHSAAHHVAELQRLLVRLSVTATVCQWEVMATMVPVWLMAERNSRQSFISMPR